ncbi:MAG: DUF4389 domain-containing protein [Pseudohongiellaceae bacterium]
MPDELDDIVENLSEPSAWVRILFMLGFAVGFYVVLVPLIGLLALAQALFAVIGGEPNDNLRRFGEGLTLYVTEILQFLFYDRQEKPFPFSNFPDVDRDEDDPVGKPSPATRPTASADGVHKTPASVPASSAGTAPKAPARKTVTKKAAAKKSAAKKSVAKKTASSNSKKKDGAGKPAPAAAATTATKSGAEASGKAQGSAGRDDSAPGDK